MRSKDLAKAIGLDLRQPQGALAEGQCGLGREGYNRTGLEEGHSRQAKTRLVIVPVLSYICRLKPIYHECCHCHLSFEEEYRKHLLNAGIEWNDYRLT